MPAREVPTNAICVRRGYFSAYARYIRRYSADAVERQRHGNATAMELKWTLALHKI